jgi:hypothetical protein
LNDAPDPAPVDELPDPLPLAEPESPPDAPAPNEFPAGDIATIARSETAGWAAFSPGFGETITPLVADFPDTADFPEALSAGAVTTGEPESGMRALNPELTSAGGGATGAEPSGPAAC